MQIRQSRSNSTSKFDRVVDPEKLDQIIAAIIAGKYSWACVLILRFAGYNPLQYIPYRTYNRLMKKNSSSACSRSHHHNSEPELVSASSAVSSKSKSSYQIGDLSYLEALGKSDTPVSGGMRVCWSNDGYLSQPDWNLSLEELAA